MGYTVTLDIKSSDFPELGNPVFPNTYDGVKAILPKENRTKVKDSYDSYVRNAKRAVNSISQSDYFNSQSKTAINDRELCIQFKYQEGTPKTYKFLGMDIDENYEAVILLADGYIPVAPMYDKDGISEAELGIFTSYGKEMITLIEDMISTSLNSDVVRTLSTAMKTGAIYDIFRGEDYTSNYSSRNITLRDLDPLVQLIKDKLISGNGGSGSYKYKSILLNMVDREKNKNLSNMAADKGMNIGSEASDNTIVAGVIAKILNYWISVVNKYNEMNSLSSEIDLWSDLGKRSLGDIEFNRRMKKSFDVVNDEDGTVVNRIVSFAGVAKDDGVLDANVFRTSAASQLGLFNALLSGATSSAQVSFQDLLIGNVNTTEFSNPYDLSIEELQAVSSYDSLVHVDEDAVACMQSYNLDDEEDRSLFIKSAIKSYDRNFRAFKPQDDYDVSQAFSDMVEKGITFGDKIISKSVSSDDMEKYEVTSSVAAIDRDKAKKSLIKVGKLINKSLDAVYDLFGASSTVATNP